MRTRLRDKPSIEELSQLYPEPHQHTRWVDHRIRAEVTVLIGLMADMVRGGIIADLSAGDAYIPTSIARGFGGVIILGDYAPGYQFMGPIEKTIVDLHELMGRVGRHVNLFTCCETLEHLEDPEFVLERIRAVSDNLLISTPIGETNDTSRFPANLEHIWGWDTDDVRSMLTRTGWTAEIHNDLFLKDSGLMYDYQIWLCK